MKQAFVLILLFISISTKGPWAQFIISGAPRVTIDAGTLMGTHFGSLPNEVAFLGIPFAAPPIGDRRWKPPQQAQAWSGIRDASEFSPLCPQFPSSWWPEMIGRDQLDTDEDCLYLNVWTTNLSPVEKQPVMVWIHGGGNVEGSSHIPPMGPTLARKGMVVVSVDYRLGVLGYLAYPALTSESAHDSSGNYGLLDQIAALQWVRRNIAAFGGDPDSITLFGESSGAEDICHLLASPLSAGLFHRAILESGVCLDSVYSALKKPQNYYRNHGSGEALGMRLTALLGIHDDQNALITLRSLTADRLLKASQGLESADFGVIIDGWVVPAQPAVAFDAGRQAAVPILVGSNAEETTVFGKATPLATENFWPKSVAQYREWLAAEFREFADEVWREYPANSDAEAQIVFIRLQSDYQFGFGAYRLARLMTRVGQPAYVYYFTYVGRGPFMALRAFHSEEMMFLSGTYWKSWHPDLNDKKLSEMMVDYWTQFAKTGNPNRSGLPAWPAYEGTTQRCLELGYKIQSRSIPHRDGYALFQRILTARLAEIAPSSAPSDDLTPPR